MSRLKSCCCPACSRGLADAYWVCRLSRCCVGAAPFWARPSVEAAQKSHNEEWRQSVIKRAGSAPTIRYFDLFLLIDNEKGTFTEFPAAAELAAA